MIRDELTQCIIKIVLEHYPTVEAVYLFGSYGTQNEWPGSDMDIGLLLPHDLAKSAKNLILSRCRFDLENALHKEIDLLNVRLMSTVFQKEIIGGGTLIYCADRYAVDEFEMLTISYYQKLNGERREILDDFIRSGRAYAV